MRLSISKVGLWAQVTAILLTAVVLFIAVVVFYNIMMNHPGSDFENNVASILASSKGYYGGNTTSNIFQLILQDAHYYFWLSVLASIFDDQALIARGITIFVVTMLVYPVAFRAGHLKNKVLLFPLLFVLFMHPRFLDLVLGNVRSASALVLFFYALRVKSVKIRNLLLIVAPTFHLGVSALLLLYITYLHLWKLPRRWSHPQVVTFFLAIGPSILVVIAKSLFPDRGISGWEGGMAYTLGVLLIAFYTFFIGRHYVNEKYVFMSLGVISLVAWGALLDYSTMRYFSFFFPCFAMAMLKYHRTPQILFITLVGFALFTLVSHSTWLLSL
jgi:hypothetical protein